MSATNRGKKREKNDFYPTDPRLVAYLLRRAGHRLPPGVWWEPMVGAGAVVRAVEAWRPGQQRWSCTDINPAWMTACEGLFLPDGPIVEHATCDFLSGVGANLTRPNVVLTNPAFCVSQATAEEALKYLAPTGVLCLLLPVNFLGSLDRIPFWQARHKPDLYVLSPRPSFGLNKHGKPGTDACEYAWFLWDAESIGRLYFPDAPWRERARRRSSGVKAKRKPRKRPAPTAQVTIAV